MVGVSATLVACSRPPTPTAISSALERIHQHSETALRAGVLRYGRDSLGEAWKMSRSIRGGPAKARG